MLASVIVDGARLTLIDAQKVTWSDAELLGYLNEGRRHVPFLKADALPVRANVSLVAGTLQSIPAGGVALLDITHNVASGKACTPVDLEMLQVAARAWYAATQEVDVANWAADTRDPRRFLVIPPNNGAGQVAVLYGSVPAAVGLSDDIVYPDTYQHALTCFVLSRAYAKNSRRQDLGKAQQFMQDMRLALGLKSQTQIAVSPSQIERTGT